MSKWERTYRHNKKAEDEELEGRTSIQFRTRTGSRSVTGTHLRDDTWAWKSSIPMRYTGIANLPTYAPAYAHVPGPCATLCLLWDVFTHDLRSCLLIVSPAGFHVFDKSGTWDQLSFADLLPIKLNTPYKTVPSQRL